MKGKEIKRSIWKLQMICGVLTVLSACFIKYYCEGSFYFFWELLAKWHSDGVFKLPYLLVVEGILFTILFGIRTIGLLVRKGKRFLYHMSYVTLWIGIMPFAVLPLAGEPTPYVPVPFALFVLSMIDFLVARYIEQRKAIKQEYMEGVAREKAEREHKKRANYFPGKYPEEFFHVIKKNFIFEWKNHFLVFLAAALVCTVTQTLLSVFRMAEHAYNSEGMYNMLLGDGLYSLFRSLGLVIAILSVFMMKMICAWYIREQKSSYRLLVVLGIRKKTAYYIFLSGFAVITISGAIAGVLFGMLVSKLAGIVFAGALGVAANTISIISMKSILLALFIYLVQMILAVAFNIDDFLALGTSTDMIDELRAEDRPEHGISVLIVIGAVLLAIATGWFAIREWAENNLIYYLIILAVLILMTGCFALYLKKRKHGKNYYDGILNWSTIYHRFNTSVGTLCFVAILQFGILGVFATQLSGSLVKQDIEAMHPYDYVYKAYAADEAELDSLIKENGIDAKKYPMLQMTSVYGGEKLPSWGSARPVLWPQGQHIAISESTYYALKEAKGEKAEKLNLKGEEMHVVYQQDVSAKTHTVDYDTTRLENHLRFGQPLINYNTSSYMEVFPDRNVVSEEKSPLLGVMLGGKQENIIVIADEYFAENWNRISAYNASQWNLRMSSDKAAWRAYTRTHDLNMTEGATELYCLNVPDDKMDLVGDKLQEFEDKYYYDRTWEDRIKHHYSKQEMMANLNSEILLERTSYGFIILMLLVISGFQYFVYVRREEKRWKWEDRFLEIMGMKEEARKERLCFQLKLNAIVPALVGVALSIVYSALTMKARLFDLHEVLAFSKMMLAIYIVYAILVAAIYLVERRHVLKCVGERK